MSVTLSPEARRARARVAAQVRHHPKHPELAEADRRLLRSEAIERHIKRIVDGFPALTQEQRDRVAELLRGGGAA